MTVHVQVTAEDIEKGVQRKSWQCPLAFALSRATGKQCQVGIDSVIICKFTKEDLVVALPNVAANKRRSYDETGLMHPFEFDIELQEVAQ